MENIKMVRVKIHTIYLIVLVITVSLTAGDSEDFLRFLEARDESIKSYQIKLRQTHFEIELADFDAFKKSIEQLAQNEPADSNPSQQAEKLIQKWAENIKWFNKNMLCRGERFKETSIHSSGGTDIRCYDGRLYYVYSDCNRQLDIHSKITNVAHTNLNEVGLATAGLSNSAKITSFQQDETGVICEFSYPDNKSRTTIKKYNSNLALSRSEYKHGDLFQIYDYYLFPKDIDGYPVPGIKINIGRNFRRNECSIWIYIIEDVRLNCPLTDEEVSLGEIPNETLVIDYRFEPEVQWHYGEYRQAAANPDVIYAGRCDPQEMIRFLDDTSSDRQALLIRDTRTGRKAPTLSIKKWLQKPINPDTWPPGRLTIVNFWSIGCGFCIREIPENNELAEWLEDKGGLFISVHSATKEPQNVVEYLENIAEWLKDKSNLLISGRSAAKKPSIDDIIDSNKIKYTVGLDEPDTQRSYWGSATFAKYGVDSIPCYVIIDKDDDVISYERTVIKQMLEKLIKPDSNGTALRKMRREDIRSLTAMPNALYAGDLEPNSRVTGRFFVFRPETQDLKIIRAETTDKTIESEWSKHTVGNQTVYEVLLTANTPDWDQKLEGDVILTTEHSNLEEQLIIPYELSSASLARYVSPIIWFGTVRSGETASRTITLQVDAKQNVVIKPVSTISNLRLNIGDQDRKTNNIPVECEFTSNESGFQKGTVELLAYDDKGNTQPLKFDYYTFVLP